MTTQLPSQADFQRERPHPLFPSSPTGHEKRPPRTGECNELLSTKSRNAVYLTQSRSQCTLDLSPRHLPSSDNRGLSPQRQGVPLSYFATVLFSRNTTRSDCMQESQARQLHIGGYPKLRRGSDEEQRRLCYDQHQVWMVTVVMTLPETLPCVLRGEVGPAGKDSASPALWRNIKRYWISRRLCRSRNCSAASEPTLAWHKQAVMLVVEGG
jgi:hypothetical protein